MEKQKTVSLPKLPKNEEFEEFIAGYYQSCGYFIQRSVIIREESEIAELDVIVTDYSNKDNVQISLLEAKSKGWGFPDIFKVRGWLDYLNIKKGIFVCGQNDKDNNLCEKVSKSLNIEFYFIDDPAKIDQVFNKPIDSIDMTLWWYSHWTERCIHKYLKKQKKQNFKKDKADQLLCYSEIDKYFSGVNNKVFYTQNIVNKIEYLYSLFKNTPRLSAKTANELDGTDFTFDHEEIPEALFQKTFFENELNPIQVSTFVEYRSRLEILKNAVDYILIHKKIKTSEPKKNSLIAKYLGNTDWDMVLLPETFRSGLEDLKKDEYFRNRSAIVLRIVDSTSKCNVWSSQSLLS